MGGIDVENNIDFNKILDSLAKMDKQELENKLKQAQSILNSKNIDSNQLGKW